MKLNLVPVLLFSLTLSHTFASPVGTDPGNICLGTTLDQGGASLYRVVCIKNFNSQFELNTMKQTLVNFYNYDGTLSTPEVDRQKGLARIQSIGLTSIAKMVTTPFLKRGKEARIVSDLIVSKDLSESMQKVKLDACFIEKETSNKPEEIGFLHSCTGTSILDIQYGDIGSSSLKTNIAILQKNHFSSFASIVDPLGRQFEVFIRKIQP